jgi:hypothetical protein
VIVRAGISSDDWLARDVAVVSRIAKNPSNGFGGARKTLKKTRCRSLTNSGGDSYVDDSKPHPKAVVTLGCRLDRDKKKRKLSKNIQIVLRLSRRINAPRVWLFDA